MSKKLNKKLVFVVGSLVLILGIVGMLWFTLIQGNTERHIRAGDEYMAAGDYAKAAETYGRAVSKKPTNLDYLAKYKDALLEITAETQTEADERYMQYLGVLESEARASRDDLARWRMSLEAAREQAAAYDVPAGWSRLADRAEAMLRAVPEEGAGAAVGRLYRGYAGFRRIDSLNEAERAAAMVDLEESLKSTDLTTVERDIALGSLARYALQERAMADGAGRRDRQDATQAALELAFAAADAGSPEGVRCNLGRLELAWRLSGGRPDSAELAQAGDRLVRSALELDESMAILECVPVLMRGGSRGAEQAVDLLSRYCEKHPERMVHRRLLGVVLKSSDRDRARQEFKTVAEASRPKTGIDSALFEANRRATAIALFDLAFEDAQLAPEAERAGFVDEATSMRDQLARLFAGDADDSTIVRADAKIALLKNDAMGAIIKFNEVFRKGSAVDLELYVLSALANIRVQEVGRALELVNGGLSLSPGNLALLKLRAQLELMTARSADAINTLRLVLDATPDDAEAQQLMQTATVTRDRDSAQVVSQGGDDPFVAFAARLQELTQAGDFDTARRMIAEQKRGTTDLDIRVARLEVAVEVQAGDLDAARKATKTALESFPNDPALVRFNAVLASDDVVERVVALAEGLVEDPKERPVAVYLRMMQTSAALRLQAEREQRLGLSTAARTRENAEKLLAAAKDWRTQADAVDRVHPALLEVDFMNALEKKEYDTIEALAKIAETQGRDRTQAPIFRARALLDQNRMQDAAQVLERAIQGGVDASTVYRTLGASLEQLGNIEGAIRNYEESYKRRPADMATVRLLVGVLIRSGDLNRALEVLRQARALAGFDEEVGNTWLRLEQQVGDRQLALRMRETRYRIAPTDLENAAALAAMLSMSAPGRDDILTEQGRPAYTENQWSSLDENARLRELDRVRESWRKRAETIFGEVLARDPANLDAASAFAGLLRAVGRTDDAERVLTAAVDAAGTDAGWRGYVMLGQLQCYLNAEDRARKSFNAAIGREDPATRAATRAIVDVLMSIERFQLALEFLEPLVRVDPSQEQKMRLAECYLRLERPEEARRAFNEGVGSGKREAGIEMLDGAISVAVGDQKRLKGDIEGALAAFGQASAPYQRAKQLVPSMPQPFIQDAMLKRKMFELTGDRARGEEALAAADRAVAVGATFLPASAARSEILVVLGDLNGAVAELQRFLRIAPTSIEARRRLIDLLYANEQLDAAETAIREAIGYAPGEPAWYASLGELQLRRGRMPEAAASFSRADALRPDAELFFKELNARIRGRDFSGAIQACRRRGELLRENPVARAYLGTALVAVGEKGDGIAALRESFAQVKKPFDAGDTRPMEAWYGAVRLLFAPAFIDEAEALIKDVSGGDPTVVGWEYLSFLALGNDSAGPARVIKYLEPLIAMDYSSMPVFGSVFFDRLGTSYYLAGRCKDALGAFEKALALSPNNAAILNNYAYLCVDCNNDAAKALPSARLAVQLEPTRGEYLDTLALVLIGMKQWREALEYSDRAAKLSDSAAVQLHRAMALQGLGQTSAAVEALARALEMNPDPPTRKSIEELKAKLN